jgi:hypothetical protein
MAVHAVVVLSNHLHLLLTPESPQQLARFMTFVGGNLAREVARLHDWKGPFWERRYQSIFVSDEELAQVDRLLYLLRQGVKEHLVERPQDWPGVHCANALLDGTPLAGLWIDRTLAHRLRRKGRSVDPRAVRSTETLSLSPLPCWKDLAPAAYRAAIADLISLVEAEGRSLTAQLGQPLGPVNVTNQAPHERPAKVKRSPAPLVHAACWEVRRVLLAAYRAFVLAFRAAAERLRAGDRLVAFPDRAFPPPLPATG